MLSVRTACLCKKNSAFVTCYHTLFEILKLLLIDNFGYKIADFLSRHL